MSVRVRFAPSPTGHLHIGGLRTALFNYLYAKNQGGQFLVRIEDTDRERYTKEHEDAIIRSLEWAGIVSDEPLVYQFARQDEHQKALQKLLASGKAYKCFCSAESLQEKREKAEAAQGFYQYDQTCRSADQSSDAPHVVRFKVDVQDDVLHFQDLIRGDVSLKRNQLDDFIVARTDGSITYNFAVVEDDYAMKVSHVIRGEDHLLNTFKQILLYQALAYDVPQFAHLPLILSQSGQKLSKRDAAVSVDEYREAGYLPEAVCNYLVRLGWSYGDQELFTKNEMIKFFSLDNVQKKGAVFDIDKLRWLNSVRLQEAQAADLIQKMRSNIDKDLEKECADWSQATVLHVVDQYKSRVQTLGDLHDQIMQLYFAPESYDPESLEQWIDNQTVTYVTLLHEKFGSITFAKDEIMATIKAFCKEQGIKMGQIAQPIRIALCGTASGPGVGDMLMMLGKDESLRRLEKLAKR